MVIKNRILITAVCLVCLWGAAPASIPAAKDPANIPKISVHQLKNMLGKPDIVIIDVRTFRSWWQSEKKIPAAVREDPAKVDQWAPKYAKDQTLIFYCA
jgi:hypothetical protein